MVVTGMDGTAIGMNGTKKARNVDRHSEFDGEPAWVNLKCALAPSSEAQ
jgi:hypothetical protein